MKRVIDVSPQETAIAEHLTAWENLRLMAGLHGLAKSDATLFPSPPPSTRPATS